MRTLSSLPMDSPGLTSLLHARGINMRYLGRIATLLEAPIEAAADDRGSAEAAQSAQRLAHVRRRARRGPVRAR